ncbi:MAG: hypothetical protein D6730_06275 [Bacteroidetes bacterium]|nr:MAG: hypothetical protein D6730_06275 [Bacteroidota bacterium]
MKIPRFILLSTGLALLLLAVLSLLSRYWIPQYSLLAMCAATAVSFVSTIFAYSITYMGLRQHTRNFIGFMMAGMLAKMLAGMLSVIIVAIQFRSVRNEYIVMFFISYFIFTGFEVYGLMRKLRAN